MISLEKKLTTRGRRASSVNKMNFINVIFWDLKFHFF